MSEHDIKIIADNLAAVDELRFVTSKGDPVEHETAYAIMDICESARKISGKILAGLKDSCDEDGVKSSLHELREELRHILYHVRDCDYFSVILE